MYKSNRNKIFLFSLFQLIAAIVFSILGTLFSAVLVTVSLHFVIVSYAEDVLVRTTYLSALAACYRVYD